MKVRAADCMVGGWSGDGISLVVLWDGEVVVDGVVSEVAGI